MNVARPLNAAIAPPIDEAVARPVDETIREKLLRCLQQTDGSMTIFLESWQNEPLAVKVAAQVPGGLPGGGKETDHTVVMAAARRTVERLAVLQGSESGRVWAYGRTVISPEALPPSLWAEIERMEQPLGRLMDQHRLATYRVVAEVGESVPPAVFGVTEPLPTRTVIINYADRPAMAVSEWFVLGNLV